MADGIKFGILRVNICNKWILQGRDCPAKLIRRQGIVLDLLKLCPIHVRKRSGYKQKLFYK
jgi:hypothetical protein